MTKEQAEEDARRRNEGAQENLHQRLIDATHVLARAAPYAELAGLMRGRGSLVTVCGWIPSSQAPRLKNMLEASFGDRFVLRARDPRTDERLRVPSVIWHHPWLRPFASSGAELRRAALRRDRSHRVLRRVFRVDVRHDVRRCRSRRSFDSRRRPVAAAPRTICGPGHRRGPEFDGLRAPLRQRVRLRKSSARAVDVAVVRSDAHAGRRAWMGRRFHPVGHHADHKEPYRRRPHAGCSARKPWRGGPGVVSRPPARRMALCDDWTDRNSLHCWPYARRCQRYSPTHGERTSASPEEKS